MYLSFPYGQIKANKLGGPDTRRRLVRLHQRCVNQVLTQKPHLKLISAQHFADNEVVCTIIPNGGCPARKLSNFTNDNLVSIEQS